MLRCFERLLFFFYSEAAERLETEGERQKDRETERQRDRETERLRNRVTYLFDFLHHVVEVFK